MQAIEAMSKAITQSQKGLNTCLDVLPPAVERAADILIGVLRMGRKVLACGNGGSAGDAQHIASELVNRFETERPALAAISLVPDSSVVTAIANDYTYEIIFSRQVQALGREGDVLIAFSTSGNSKNVLRAVDAAHHRRMRVIAFTGRDGGKIAGMLNRFDVELRVPLAETARIQEIHLLLIHTLCKMLDSEFATPTLESPDKVQRDWRNLVRMARGLRPLVFTNGVFDLLHRGHVAYLQAARSRGSCLIVGVNSDHSVRRLGKGPERPIQTAEDRAHILASLSCIDFVTIFDEGTPAKLIAELLPDILVKGGDYTPSEIAGADTVLAAGGVVDTIPFEFVRSTTEIVRRVAVGTEIPS